VMRIARDLGMDLNLTVSKTARKSMLSIGSVRSIYWHCAMPTALSSQLAGWALSRQTSIVRRHPR
jgi:hypothetical protein